LLLGPFTRLNAVAESQPSSFISSLVAIAHMVEEHEQRNLASGLNKIVVKS
jgi:hypothetical protein